MIYVPDPVEVDLDSIEIGDWLTLHGRTYTVYYVGEYPPPHFEQEEYSVVPEQVGEPVIGLRDINGDGHWVGAYEAYGVREMFRRPRSTL